MRSLSSVVIFVCGGLLIGCAGGRVGPEAKLKQLIIAPASAQIPKGASVHLGASGMFDDGVQRPLDGSPIWTSSEPSIATVDAEGNVKGVAEGNTQVSATYQGITGVTSIDVAAPALSSITISPGQSSLPLGESVQLTATGNFSDGSVQDLTQSATWSSSTSAIASVSSAGSALALGTGTTTITATSATISGSASLSVTSPAVMSLTVAPASLSISLGTSHQAQATAGFSNGTTQDVTSSVTWISSQPAIATVSSQGNVTGVGKGASQLSATYQGATATATVAVGPATLVSIGVSLNPATLPVGETGQLTATGKYTDGSVQDLTQSANWTSSGSAATVTPAGSVSAKSAGTVTLTATDGSIVGSTSLTVTSAVATALTVTPAILSLSLGNGGRLQAMATMSDGTTQDMSGTATWTSSATTVVTVSAQGNIVSVGKGAAQVSASYQGLTGNSAINVGPPALVGLTVSPSQSSLPVGESEQLMATGNYTDGSTQNLSQSATWISAAPATATVSAAGKVVANAIGTTTVNVSSGSIAGSASLNVTAPVVTALNIVPSTVSMLIGSNRQLQAMATLSDGSTQDMSATVAWSSTQPNVAMMSSAGVANAMQIGSTTVLAQTNNVNGSADLSVVPLQLVNYFNHAAAVSSGVDGTLQLANPGLTAGNTVSGDLCAMVYVFDQNQELNECCGCRISDSGLKTLSLLYDLTANPVTGTKPNVGEIKIVPSDPSQNPQCDAASLTPSGALTGWETNPQVSPGTLQVTETEFAAEPLSATEAAFVANMCTYLEKLGSGKGICTCGTGD